MTELEFIHDITNKLTVADGKLGRIMRKAEQFSKEEIMVDVEKSKDHIQTTFELIKERKAELEK